MISVRRSLALTLAACLSLALPACQGGTSNSNKCSGEADCRITYNAPVPPTPDDSPLHLIGSLEGCPTGWYLDRTPEEMEKSPEKLSFESLAKEGIPISGSGGMAFLLTATTPSEEASLITGLHVEVSRRERPRSGLVVVNTQGCGANSSNRLMDMNLDQEPVQLGAYDNSWVDPMVPAVRFPVQLTTRDSEAFELFAYTDSVVSFSVKVDWRVQSKEGVSLFDNKKRGYTVAGYGNLPKYSLDTDAKTLTPYGDALTGTSTTPKVCGEFPFDGQRVQILDVSGDVGCATAVKVADARATGRKFHNWSCSTNSQDAIRSTGVFSRCTDQKARVVLVRPGIVRGALTDS
ncbi:hypothetical protein [Streptomyces sp. NPDC001770]